MAVLKRRQISWIEALPAIATFGVVLIVGLAGGGFFPRTWRLTLLALLLLSAAALVARDRITFRRREWVALTAFGALTAWTAASSEWSSLPTGSLIESERTLLYTVGLLTVLVGVAASSLPHILLGALAGVTGVSAYALGRHVLSPPPLDPFQGTHLHEPFATRTRSASFSCSASCSQSAFRSRPARRRRGWPFSLRCSCSCRRSTSPPAEGRGSRSPSA